MISINTNHYVLEVLVYVHIYLKINMNVNIIGFITSKWLLKDLYFQYIHTPTYIHIHIYTYTYTCIHIFTIVLQQQY